MFKDLGEKYQRYMKLNTHNPQGTKLNWTWIVATLVLLLISSAQIQWEH